MKAALYICKSATLLWKILINDWQKQICPPNFLSPSETSAHFWIDSENYKKSASDSESLPHFWIDSEMFFFCRGFRIPRWSTWKSAGARGCRLHPWIVWKLPHCHLRAPKEEYHHVKPLFLIKWSQNRHACLKNHRPLSVLMSPIPDIYPVLLYCTST